MVTGTRKSIDKPVTAHALRQQATRRSNTNHETYRMLYGQVQTALQEHARNHPKVYFLAWKVPPYMYGRPLYRHAHAVRYIAEKLSHAGFKVSPAPGAADMLIVDWTPAPLPRVPLDVRAGRLHRRMERERERDARDSHYSRQKTKKTKRLNHMVQSSVVARETAESLNDHLEKLLASLG